MGQDFQGSEASVQGTKATETTPSASLRVCRSGAVFEPFQLPNSGSDLLTRSLGWDGCEELVWLSACSNLTGWKPVPLPGIWEVSEIASKFALAA